MYAYTRGTLPTPLRHSFMINAAIHDHNTRQRYDVHIAPSTSCIIARFYTHKGPKLWRELPPAYKTINSLKLFNTRVKNCLGICPKMSN